jgi:hypothetical protein
MTQAPSTRRHVPTSAIGSFLDAGKIEALLAPWVPDVEARRFVVRCILGEGPAHHRGANYVLLTLLGRVLERAGARAAPAGEQVAIPIRLPPQMAAEHDDGEYPLAFPRRVVEQLAPGDPAVQAAMIDCLTDGPPQHTLANAAMLCLLDALLGGAR